MNMLFSIAQEIPGINHNKGCGGARIAAALFIKNELVSIGVNQARSSPFQAKFGKNSDSIYLHAELHAVKQALRNWSEDELRSSKTTLYICRAKRHAPRSPFIWGIARPCSGCMGALGADWFNIKNIVYSLNENDGGRRFEILSR